MKWIKETPPLSGDDAEALLKDLKDVASEAEIIVRQEVSSRRLKAIFSTDTTDKSGP